VQPPSCCCHGWINHPEPEFDKGLLILPPVSGALVLGFHGPEVFDLKCYRDPAGCGYRIQADSCFTYATHGASDWLVIVDREYVVRKAGLKKVSEE
jgi:hypothetical protein